MSDGAVVRLRRHGNPQGPRLVLSHGNGLAIGAYAPFWLPLCERFDVVLFDMRNHGENPLHGDLARHRWPVFTEDFEAIFQGIQRHFGAAATIGVFHSLSAVTALTHALAHPGRWAALALFDPPILPRTGHPLQEEEAADVREHVARARRRPPTYDRLEDMAAQVLRRPAYARWHPDAPMLLAQSTLRPMRDGGFALCCPREFEAQVFEQKEDTKLLWFRLRDLDIPAILIGGDPECPDATPSARVCRALHEEIGIAYVAIPDTTHFLQIEKPQACRDALIAFLGRHGLLQRDGAAPRAEAVQPG